VNAFLQADSVLSERQEWRAAVELIPSFATASYHRRTQGCKFLDIFWSYAHSFLQRHTHIFNQFLVKSAATMSENMSTVDLQDKQVPTVSVIPTADENASGLHPAANTKEESKVEDPLLSPSPPQTPFTDRKTLSSTSSSPVKRTFTGNSTDEEKVSKASIPPLRTC
jgi:hypothetical protein